MIARLHGLLARMPAPAWMLVALVAGFTVGTFTGRAAPVVDAARLLGGVWLDGLRMTILPLVFSLVVTGVADLATGSDHPGRQIGKRLPLVLAGYLIISAITAALIAPPLFRTFPLAPDVVAGLRGNVTAPQSAIPSTMEAITGLIPVNVVASAAQGAMVPVVIFALVLGLALSRVERSRAATTLGPFRGLADAMIVVVGWVLRLAPFGIFALALVIGATAGISAAVALAHYILIQIIVAVVLTLIPYFLTKVLGRVPLGLFARAIAPAQAVAAGTQSSIATLPAMLASAARIGVAESDTSVILPLAVAVFKVTAPSGTLLGALACAWMAGVPVAHSQIIIAIPISLLSTLLVIGMPGGASFITAATPTAIALGAPVELLPILLAIDTIPDTFRTVANVTADVSATAIIAPPRS